MNNTYIPEQCNNKQLPLATVLNEIENALVKECEKIKRSIRIERRRLTHFILYSFEKNAKIIYVLFCLEIVQQPRAS